MRGSIADWRVPNADCTGSLLVPQASHLEQCRAEASTTTKDSIILTGVENDVYF